MFLRSFKQVTSRNLPSPPNVWTQSQGSSVSAGEPTWLWNNWGHRPLSRWPVTSLRQPQEITPASAFRVIKLKSLGSWGHSAVPRVPENRFIQINPETLLTLTLTFIKVTLIGVTSCPPFSRRGPLIYESQDPNSNDKRGRNRRHSLWLIKTTCTCISIYNP